MHGVAERDLASAQVVVRALPCSIGSLISVIEYLVFLAVDQQLVQVATLRVVPELAAIRSGRSTPGA